MHRSDKKRAILLAVIVAGALMASMAFNNGCMRNPDPELQLTPYQEARIVYNGAAKAYLAYYDAQPAEKRPELYEEVGKLFLDADDVLKKWKKAEESGQSVLENVELWATLLEKITAALDRYGVEIGG